MLVFAVNYMFHVKQFDFGDAFHVEQKLSKVHCLVGILRLFWVCLIKITSLSLKILQKNFTPFTQIFQPLLFRKNHRKNIIVSREKIIAVADAIKMLIAKRHA